MGLQIKSAARDNEQIKLKLGTNPGWDNEFRESWAYGDINMDENGRVTLTFDLNSNGANQDFIKCLSDEVYGGLEVVVKNKRRG